MLDRFTENVDLSRRSARPWVLDIPAQCDGLPLTVAPRGESPHWWREEAHWEYDWRWEYIPFGPHPWPWDRRLETKHLTRVAFGRLRIRAIRRRRVALLRSGARPDMAHRGVRQQTWCSNVPRPCSHGVPDSPTGHSPTCFSIGGGMGRIPTGDQATNLAELVELLTADGRALPAKRKD